MFRSFTEMPVWQKAQLAMVEAYLLADKLPKHELFSMASQIRSSALSIPGNIAEAFGRHYKKDKQNFYFYSRGSANETISHFLCAVAVGYYSTEEIILIEKLCNEVIEELNKIIKSLD